MRLSKPDAVKLDTPACVEIRDCLCRNDIQHVVTTVDATGPAAVAQTSNPRPLNALATKMGLTWGRSESGDILRRVVVTREVVERL